MNSEQVKIEFICTERGNKLLKELRCYGWRLVDEYPMVFDKGIDYDYYTFRKNNRELKLEWTNWFEWEVSGSKRTIAELASQFELDLKN